MFFLDSRQTKKLGVDFNSIVCRDNYNTLPYGNYINLIVNKGETDKKKMISNTNKGLYITEIEQIRSDLKSGRMFIKASGNWINFGEISYPVENIFISNDSIRVLRNIVEISDDLQIMGRINSPTFKISEMEIKNQL